MTNSKIITNFLNDVLNDEYTDGFVDNAKYNWHLFHKFYWVFKELELNLEIDAYIKNRHNNFIGDLDFLMCNEQTPEEAFDKLVEAVEWYNSL
jgi:hypothetical protein